MALARLRPPEKLLLRSGLASAALGLGAVTAGYEWSGMALMLFGIFLLASSLRPTIRSLPALKRLREAGRRRRVAEQEETDSAQRRLEAKEQHQAFMDRRARVAPMLAAFDEYLPAAGQMQTVYRELRDAETITPREWGRFRRAARRARDLAGNLPQEQAEQMLRLLEPFRKAKKDRLEALDHQDFVLGEMLFSYSACQYEPLRRELGLPAPKYRSSRPPS